MAIRTGPAKKIRRAVDKLTPAQRIQLASLSTPRIVEPFFRHIPHPAQQVFLMLNNKEVMYGGSAGSGKSDALLFAALQYALWTKTPVATVDGWSTIGDLRVGDRVFDETGRPIKVVAKSAKYMFGDRYKLTFDDGQAIVADGDHLWLAETFNDRMSMGRNPAMPRRYVSTREMYCFRHTNHARPMNNWSIRLSQPLDLPDVELAVDPYVLGVWLGDGSRNGGTIAGIDSEVPDEFRKLGYQVTNYGPHQWHVKGLRTQLNKLGVLNDRHVPHEYLRASKDQRLALLQGLMDTDGTVDSRWGIPRFANTDEGLIEAVMELANSLGWKARRFKDKYVTAKNKYERTIHVVTFIADVPVFRLPRKSQRQVIGRERAAARAQTHRTVTSIKKLKNRYTVQCITVDSPSHMFLAGKGMVPTHNCDVPGYKALILRRTWPDLSLPGAIMRRAAEWLNGSPAQIHEGGRWWEFPSGATLHFGHLLRDKDKLNYQGSDYSFIAFDELTQWEREETYDYLFSRLRKPQITCLNCMTAVKRKLGPDGKPRYRHANPSETACTQVYPDPKVIAQYPPSKDGLTIFDVPLRMRSATNPGGPGNDWVKARFIDERTKRRDAIFVPALLRDNPSLNEEEYRESLSHLNSLDRERLLNGDWTVVDHGDFFDRGDFEPVDQGYVDAEWRVRYWDMAATQGGGDWTVGALLSKQKVTNKICVESIVRFQKSPADTEMMVRRTAMMDGVTTSVRMEQEPGSSGKTVIDHFKRNVLAGYNFEGIRATGTKEARAMALSSYVKAGHVSMVVSRWNKDYLDEMEVFPRGSHDDQVDATAGAFNELTLGRRARILV